MTQEDKDTKNQVDALIQNIVTDLPLIVHEISRAQLLKVLKDANYSAELEHEGDIEWRIDGFLSYLLIAMDGRMIGFQTGFHGYEVSDFSELSEKMNKWHRIIRFARTYSHRKEDGSLRVVLELDLDLTGGVTRDRLVDFLKTCVDIFAHWRREIL